MMDGAAHPQKQRESQQSLDSSLIDEVFECCLYRDPTPWTNRRERKRVA